MKKLYLFAVLISFAQLAYSQINVSTGGTVQSDIHEETDHKPSNLIDGVGDSFYAHMRLEDAGWRINLPKPAYVKSIDFVQGWGDWTQALTVEITVSSGEKQIVTLNPLAFGTGDRTPEKEVFNFKYPTSFVDVRVLTVRAGARADVSMWGGFGEMTVWGNLYGGTDVTAPKISKVSVTKTSATAATVNWETDEPARSLIKFSSSTANVIESPVDTNLRTCHSMQISHTGNLTGLIDIWASDKAGNGTQQWHHGFSTVKTHMQYALGDIKAKDSNGATKAIKDLLAQDGVKSDYVQTWVGQHGSGLGPDWRTFLTKEDIISHVNAGYEFQMLHFFLGDYATRTLVTDQDAKLKQDLADLATMIKATGVEDKVLVTLEPDWNQPACDLSTSCLANWESWNDKLIGYMNTIKAIAPNCKVGLIAGNWDYYHHIPISMSRAAKQADYFAFQEMIMSPKKTIEDAKSMVYRAEKFIRYLRKHFMKPVRWDYVVVSDYGTGWDQIQQDAVKDLFANVDRLHAAGLTAMTWMAYQDDPTQTNQYYGMAETQKGLKNKDNIAKPAFATWKNSTTQAFANRGVVVDPYSDNNGITGCTTDCNGDIGGTAYLDNCKVCVGGKTGKTACKTDCNGVLNGTAYFDSCSTCVGGTTGKTACVKDCNNVWGGTAYTDNCNVCVGGTTGKTACQPCNTIPGAAGTISGSASICEGSTATYSIAAVTNATSYTWTIPSGASIISGDGTKSIAVLFGNGSSGSIKVTPVGTCASGSSSSKSVTVNSNTSIDLGPDADLCKPSTITLDAGIAGATYSWTKNGVKVSNEQTLVVTEAGTYAVAVINSDCPEVTDEIIVTSSSAQPVNDTICSPGTVNLGVIGDGNYDWYDAPTGGNLLSSGASYSPGISQTTPFYVQDNSNFEQTIGPDVNNHALNDMAQASYVGINLTAYSSFQITEMTVYPFVWSCGFGNDDITLTLELKTAGGTLISSHVATPVPCKGTQSSADGAKSYLMVFNSPISVTEPGDYVLKPSAGSTLFWYKEGATYSSWGAEGVVSITGNTEAWKPNSFPGMFNIKISSGGKACDRTVVYGVVGPTLPPCLLTSIDEMTKHEISAYPNPSNGVFMINNMPENNEITIVDITGKVIYAAESGTSLHRVNISNQPSGIYYVKLKSNKTNIVKRIVLMH